MADITINITLPVLMDNQGFLIESRVYGSGGAWEDKGVFTTNNITISGYDPGTCFEFRITFVKSIEAAEYCDSITKKICVPVDQPCATISGEITLEGEVYTLEINIAPPSPYTNPCGGWVVGYGQITSPQQPLTYISLSTLIGNETINVPGVSNVPYLLVVYSVDCNGNRIPCDQDIAVEYTEPCTPAILSSAEMIFQGGAYYLKLIIVPSNPASTTYYISYQQANGLSSGVNDSGNAQVTPTGLNPETFLIPISPNLNIIFGAISYIGAIVDRCNKTHRFDISYIR